MCKKKFSEKFVIKKVKKKIDFAEKTKNIYGDLFRRFLLFSSKFVGENFYLIKKNVQIKLRHIEVCVAQTTTLTEKGTQNLKKLKKNRSELT